MSACSVASLFSAISAQATSRVTSVLLLTLFALCFVGFAASAIEALRLERYESRSSRRRDQKALTLLFAAGLVAFGVACYVCSGLFNNAGLLSDNEAVTEDDFAETNALVSTSQTFIPNVASQTELKLVANVAPGGRVESRAYAPESNELKSSAPQAVFAAPRDEAFAAQPAAPLRNEEVAPAPLSSATMTSPAASEAQSSVSNISASVSHAYAPDPRTASGTLPSREGSDSLPKKNGARILDEFSPSSENAALEYCFSDKNSENPISPTGFAGKESQFNASQIGVSNMSVSSSARSADSLLNRLDEEKANVSREVRVAVLTLNVKKKDASNSDEVHGSGFAVQYDGRVFVVTNQHVVEFADSCRDITISTYDGLAFQPVRVFSCPDFDVAALELAPNTVDQLKGLRLCRLASSSELEAGFGVFTIGAPLFMDWTMTYCHVGKLYRDTTELKSAGIIKENVETQGKNLVRYIQISGIILEGNSGGPLFNAQGDVVGIVTATIQQDACSTGIGFAIPIEDALSVIRNMVDSGSWNRSFLGVVMNGYESDSVARINGVEVSEVNPNSPAEQAGIKVGDRIRVFNGEQVRSRHDLARMIALCKPGEQGNMEIFRDGRSVTVDFTPRSGVNSAIAKTSGRTSGSIVRR